MAGDDSFRARMHNHRLAEANDAAEWDWSEDVAKEENGKYSPEVFYNSIFELADIWTDGIDEMEYAAFIWKLLRFSFTFHDFNGMEPDASFFDKYPPEPLYRPQSLSTQPKIIPETNCEMLDDYLKTFNGVFRLESEDTLRVHSGNESVKGDTQPREPIDELVQGLDWKISHTPSAISLPLGKSDQHTPSAISLTFGQSDRERRKHGRRRRASSGSSSFLGYGLMCYLEAGKHLNVADLQSKAERSGSITRHGNGYIRTNEDTEGLGLNQKTKNILVKSTRTQHPFERPPIFIRSVDSKDRRHASSTTPTVCTAQTTVSERSPYRLETSRDASCCPKTSPVGTRNSLNQKLGAHSGGGRENMRGSSVSAIENTPPRVAMNESSEREEDNEDDTNIARVARAAMYYAQGYGLRQHSGIRLSLG